MKELSKKLISKINYYGFKSEYGGYFTPTEIKTLIEHGAKPSGYTNGISYYEKLIEQGKSNPHWFYFKLNSKELKSKFGQKLVDK